MPPLMTALSTLGYAIASQDHHTITNILRDAGAGGKGGAGFLLNQFDYSGNTPLHLAAASDDIAILTDFLKRGASVHLRNRDGRTPLFVAAKAGRIGNVRLLKESGAHLHADEMEVAKLLKKRAFMVRDAGAKVRAEGWELAGA